MQYVLAGQKCVKNKDGTLNVEGFMPKDVDCLPKCILENLKLIDKNGVTFDDVIKKTFNPSNSKPEEDKITKCLTANVNENDNDICNKTSKLMECLCVGSQCERWQKHIVYTQNCVDESNLSFPLTQQEIDTKCVLGCIAEKMDHVDSNGVLNKKQMLDDYPLTTSLIKSCLDINKGNKCDTMKEIKVCIVDKLKQLNL